MYSLISADDKEVNKAKRINITLRHEQYVDALFNKKVMRHNMKKYKVNYIKLVLMMFTRYH